LDLNIWKPPFGRLILPKIVTMKELLQLPIGQQYFSNLRQDNQIYIDKTKYIFEFCQRKSAFYFLSRPRRFGKSLLLDTIGELFEGNQPLFEGLWIADKWDWSQNYPVIRMSLDAIGHEKTLDIALQLTLQEIAESFEVELKRKTTGAMFKELIEKVARKRGKQVVILIDEYDRPIVDHIDPYNFQKAIEQRDTLKKFFDVLKNASKHIRLLFITGITKFARVSLFSSLNHLVDLTLNPNYAALCGYTQAELETSFAPYLETMPPNTLQELKKWYDGYSWDGETFLYNPFSILNFFFSGRYENYWFQTGTPSFLVRLLSKRFEYQLQEKEVSNLILENFVLEHQDKLDIDSLLLQTGYLTIKQVKPHQKWVLNYPNQEVRQAFGQFLLAEFTDTRVSIPYGADILEALDNNNVPKVIAVLNQLIQAIPDQNYIKNEEKFFHAVIHLIFTMIGTDVRYEMHTPIGRADTVVITPERIFIFEFKVDESADDALQQIIDKRYAEALRYRNLPIIGIGVSFQSSFKGISKHEIKVL
jgi:Predicted AAA-ATPase/PD-(D/E)XK nuclease superfamily